MRGSKSVQEPSSGGHPPSQLVTSLTDKEAEILPSPSVLLCSKTDLQNSRTHRNVPDRESDARQPIIATGTNNAVGNVELGDTLHNKRNQSACHRFSECHLHGFFSANHHEYHNTHYNEPAHCSVTLLPRPMKDCWKKNGHPENKPIDVNPYNLQSLATLRLTVCSDCQKQVDGDENRAEQ